MSFSLLVSQHHPKSPDRVEAWETAFLELQVVLAYIDSVLAPAERMTLSLLNLAKWDEKDNRRQVDELTRSIEKHGIDQAVRRVIRKLEELFEQEDPTIRPHLAQEILQSSVAIVVADDVISDNEESFLRDLLAPALGMDEAHVMEVVKTASGRLSRFRAYAERGLECYLMLAELQEGPPQLNSLAGDKLPGFLGAVDQWVVQHRLGSSRVMGYFLGAMGGIFWIDSYEQHLSEMTQLVAAARTLSQRAGPEARLRAIHHELTQLRNRGVDANGHRAIARHVTNALSRMASLNEAQRNRFRDAIAPALEIDHDALVESASQRASLIDLHDNLVGAHSPEQDKTESQWWRFWK